MTIASRLLATATTTALLVVATATASGEELTLEPAGSVSITSNGTLTFSAEPLAVACNFTLTGSLSEGPIAVAEGSHLGDVAELEISACDGGDVRSFLSLPWSFDLAQLTGTFPNELATLETEFTEVSVQFATLGPSVNCLYAGTSALESDLTPTRSEGVYTLREIAFLEEARALPLVSGGFLCPDEGIFSGSLAITPTQTVMAARPVGQLTATPTTATIPRETEEEKEITLTNDAILLAADIDINAVSGAAAEFEVDADACENDELAPSGGFCKILVRSNPMSDDAALEVDYDTGGLTGLDKQVILDVI